MKTFLQTASELESLGNPFAIITLAKIAGHVPQEVGAKAIVTHAGLYWGTVGGGKVEAKAIQHALGLISNAGNVPGAVLKSSLAQWNLQTDVGMSCGGEATFLFELFNVKSWRIAIFGAGHVAQALVRTLAKLDCQIICLDTRAEWLEKLPCSVQIEKVLAEDLANEVDRFCNQTFFVVMTQGHATDLPILEGIMKKFSLAPYIGVMGSQVKSMKIRNELTNKDVDSALVEKLFCPIGYKIGSNTPEEIALTVACQLIQIRDERRGKLP